MKTKITFLALLTILLAADMPAMAADNPSDAAMKQKLLGYWMSPRHGYLIKSNGIMYMCPRKECITTNKWNVKAGLFYQDSFAYRIVSLTDKKFVYRDTKDGATFTLVRTTEKEAEAE